MIKVCNDCESLITRKKSYKCKLDSNSRSLRFMNTNFEKDSEGYPREFVSVKIFRPKWCLDLRKKKKNKYQFINES